MPVSYGLNAWDPDTLAIGWGPSAALTRWRGCGYRARPVQLSGAMGAFGSIPGGIRGEVRLY